VTPSDYEYLCALLKRRSGLTLTNDKQYLIESRLRPIIQKGGLSSIEALIQKVRSGDEALTVDVVEAMTTNETFFFRDKVPFEHFRDFVLPELMARRPRKSLRIWCAASSTGQEPYSLAMILKEKNLAGWRTEIIATDLSKEVLDRSKSGLFTQFEVQRGLPIQMLMTHFAQVGDMWQISPALRAMVQFRQLNLLQDFSNLGMFDVIFCRNVLIYFDQETKQDIFARIHRILEPDGFFALGAAETVVGLTTRFVPCPDRRGLYRPVGATPAPVLSAMAPKKTQTA
jgi:chemotaxis protein methyltransferase CheR